MVEEQGDNVAGPGGLDRRALIKRAAAVGAAAWTAPAVIGSLASPAGALTLSGCYRAEYLRGSGACGSSTYWTRQQPPANGSGCLEPNDWNNQPDYPGTITATTEATGTTPNTCRTIITITDTDCVIDLRSAVRKDQGNLCYTSATAGGSVGAACRTISIAHPDDVDRIKIMIACGGTPCPGGSACPV